MRDFPPSHEVRELIDIIGHLKFQFPNINGQLVLVAWNATEPMCLESTQRATDSHCESRDRTSCIILRTLSLMYFTGAAGTPSVSDKDRRGRFPFPSTQSATRVRRGYTGYTGPTGCGGIDARGWPLSCVSPPTWKSEVMFDSFSLRRVAAAATSTRSTRLPCALSGQMVMNHSRRQLRRSFLGEMNR